MKTIEENKPIQIVVLDGYSTNPGDLSWNELEQLGNVKLYPRTLAHEVVERAKHADVVLLNKTPLHADTIAQLSHLQYVGVLATGFNTVDVEAAKERGIVVCNVPSYSTYSVAQMVFSLLFSVMNRVEHYANETRAGKWSESNDFCYWNTPLYELAGKTLGIVGLGNIGKKVARIARDFGMEVYAYTSKNACDLPEDIQKTTLEGLFSVSDVLTLHCPLNEQTHQLINAHSLKLMKDGAILINTARGAVVDEIAVAEALSAGKLRAYCADVMEHEPPSADHPLLKQPNAYITPHIAWATIEARTRLLSIATDNVKAFLEGKPQNIV